MLISTVLLGIQMSTNPLFMLPPLKRGLVCGSLCALFDRRKLKPNGTESVWTHHKSSVFGSSTEDGLLSIWDYEKVGRNLETGTRSQGPPPGLFLQHAGHRLESWTISSS